MSDRTGLFTGSFDPITIGHVQLIERASRLFDRVYVGIFYNPEKVGLFSIEANMDYFNHQLAPELETIYLYAQPPYQAISSTRIRELLTFQQDISPYVPESVMEEIKDDPSE